MSETGNVTTSSFMSTLPTSLLMLASPASGLYNSVPLSGLERQGPGADRVWKVAAISTPDHGARYGHDPPSPEHYIDARTVPRRAHRLRAGPEEAVPQQRRRVSQGA